MTYRINLVSDFINHLHKMIDLLCYAKRINATNLDNLNRYHFGILTAHNANYLVKSIVITTKVIYPNVFKM